MPGARGTQGEVELALFLLKRRMSGDLVVCTYVVAWCRENSQSLLKGRWAG